MGYLMLNGGRRGDKQLIPEDYARDAIASGAMPWAARYNAEKRK